MFSVYLYKYLSNNESMSQSEYVTHHLTAVSIMSVVDNSHIDVIPNELFDSQHQYFFSVRQTAPQTTDIN